MGNSGKTEPNSVRTFTPKKEKTLSSKIIKTAAAVIGVAAFWIAVWALLSLKINSELLLPSPWTVIKRLFELSGASELWKATGATLLRILAGFLTGVAAGTVLAALTAWSRSVAVVFAPIGKIIKATPVASFIILTLVWIPAGNIPSFIVFLLVTPIVWDALKTAILSTDRALLEMARAYRFGRRELFFHVYFPSVLPAYLSSVLTALGLAWKSGIAAEVLCLPSVSIGRRLYESKIYLEMTDLFAWTMLVIILSVIMEAAIRFAVRKTQKRKGAAVG